MVKGRSGDYCELSRTNEQNFMSMYSAKDRKNILDKILREDIQI